MRSADLFTLPIKTKHCQRSEPLHLKVRKNSQKKFGKNLTKITVLCYSQLIMKRYKDLYEGDPLWMLAKK